MHEVHSKTTCLPIPRKPDTLLGNLILLKHGMKMLQLELIIRFLEGREQSGNLSEVASYNLGFITITVLLSYV